MSVVILGSTFLALWLVIAAVAVRYDIGEDAVWKIVALLGNFFWLTMALPSFVEKALCTACWSDKATAQLNALVLGALIMSAIFIFDIARMTRAALERRQRRSS